MGLFFRGDPLPPGSWLGKHPTKKPSILGVVLQGGSSFLGFLVRKPPNREAPPGKEGSFYQITSGTHTC